MLPPLMSSVSSTQMERKDLALWFRSGLGVVLGRCISTDFCGSGNQHGISEHQLCAWLWVPRASHCTTPSEQSSWTSHTCVPHRAKCSKKTPLEQGGWTRWYHWGFLSTSITLQFCAQDQGWGFECSCRRTACNPMISMQNPPRVIAYLSELSLRRKINPFSPLMASFSSVVCFINQLLLACIK